VLRPELPKWIDVVLGRALAKLPEDRYDSVADFGRALLAGAGTGSNRTTVLAGAVKSGGLLATYEIGDRVGPGRLGSEVFRGTHRGLGHPVAIRLLRRGAERSWDAVRGRFLREARTLQVGHPSIIQVRDYGEEGDLVYLVTDFIAGRSLRAVLQTDGAMPWSRLQPMLAQLLEAARVMHRRAGSSAVWAPTSCASRRRRKASAS
jgi:serine/threonine protein kinase